MRTIYKAFDGTEFDNEFECRRYETECQIKIIDDFESLHTNCIKAWDYLEIASCNFCSEDEVTCVSIENEECLKIVNAYLERLESNITKDALTDDMIGKKVAFWVWDSEVDGCCLGTREEMLANYNKALDRLFGEE